MRHRLMCKVLLVPVLSGILVLSSLVQPQSALPLVGQWGVTFAIDAPWRLEPIPTSSGYGYGKIPIVISFRQAINEMGREYGSIMRQQTDAGPAIWVGKVTGVTVIEYIDPLSSSPKTSIDPAQFREIERKRELSTKEHEPSHEICRPFLGEPCDNILWVTDTDEWHAVFWYTPQAPVTPGRNIQLEVKVTSVSSENNPHSWTSSLVVHAGEAPLPRFDNNWLYGDLHYHAQMTGNEGEYGHAYRNVARILGSLGLDFVFTTDHASNGEQVLGKVTIGRCGSINGSICKNFPNPLFHGDTQCTDEDKVMQCMMYRAVAARDLNESRFAWAKAFIYGPGGANDAVAQDAEFGFGRLHSANILPQLYMGEEVDAQPEMSSKEHQDGVIYYGDGLKYPWPDVNHCITKPPFALPPPEAAQYCRGKYSERYAERDHRSYIVKDVEGISIEEKVGSAVGNAAHIDFLGRLVGSLTSGLLALAGSDLNIEPIIVPARQHLVYLPTDASSSSIGWIASDTTKFGGAGKHLEDVIHEVEANNGYTFLAHPLVGPRPGGPGPDVVPYSDYSLDRAWRSQSVLGLQFWNEDYNRVIDQEDKQIPLLEESGHGYTLMAPFRPRSSFFAFPWTWEPRSWEPAGHGAPPSPKDSGPAVPEDLWLYDGAYTWDRYLRKGLNTAETAMLPWLSKGEPRKWFMAGGSDAHGDFNYRILGEVCDSRWCTTGIVDTAIGKTRNLVMVAQPPRGIPPPDLPDAKRYTNSQVIEALKTGQFSITNGPAIRIAIDKNRNGRIDNTDFQMGSTFNLFPGEQIPLLVEWESTPEFGPLAQIDVYVGSPSTTYAPKNHGPVIPMAPEYPNVPPTRNPDYGNYHADPTGALQIKLVADKSDASAVANISPEMRLHGVAQFLLSPQEFGLSSADQSLFYLRAFAKTREGNAAAFHGECPPFNTAGTNCGSGRTYSNPIWGRFNMACPAKPAGSTSGELGYLDADNNGVPDICERIIPDPCPGAIGGVVTNSGGLRPDFPTTAPVESPSPTPPQVSAPPTPPVNPTGQLSAPRSCQLPVRLVSHEPVAPVTPSSTGSISGTVINADTKERLVGKVIQVKGSEIIARTDNNGNFTLEGIPQGPQTVLFVMRGFRDGVTRTVTVVPGQSVSVGTVAMPVRTFTGTLIGNVVDDTTQAPIPKAIVAVTVDPPGKSIPTTTETDSDGQFEFLNFPAGFITITVSKPGFTSKTLPGQVKEDRTGNAGVIRLVPN